MDLYITGEDLTLEQLYQAADGEIASFVLQPCNAKVGEEPSCPEQWKPRHTRHSGRYPQEVGAMALVLLANTAARIPGLVPMEQLSSALNRGQLPVIHTDHFDVRSAMDELLETAGIRIPGQQERMRPLAYDCVSMALAASFYRRGQRLAETADLCVAMHMEASRGEPAAFDRRLHELGRPFQGQIDAAAHVRGLLKGSGFTTWEARAEFGYDSGPRCQDAICIRAAPQTHGGVRDALAYLRRVLEQQLSVPRAGKNMVLAHALEHAATALVDLGNISERRSFRLLDSHLSYGLTDNLVYENPGYNHGMAVVQEAATALLGEMKLMALPAVATVEAGRASVDGTQFQSSAKGMRMLPFLEKILAVEVLMAAQAMDLVKRALPARSFGKGTAAAHARYRREVSVCERNRYLIRDLEATYHLVADGELVRAAQSAALN